MSIAARALFVVGLGVLGLAAKQPAALSDDRALAATVVPSGGFPKAITDPLGGTTRLENKPRRVASISLVTDEMLADLVDVDRVVGVTYLVDDLATTEIAGRYPASIVRTSEEPEALMALEPDLVVAAGYTRAETIRLLSSAGLPVFRIGRHDSLDDVFDATLALGRAVGEERRAEEVVASARGRLAQVEQARRGHATPRLLFWDGGYSYGTGTLQDDLIRRAGARNVVAEAGMRGPVALTEEALVALEPEVVITSIEGADVQARTPSLLGEDPIVKAVGAFRSGRVHGIPRRWIGAVSRRAVSAVEAIASVVEEPR